MTTPSTTEWTSAYSGLKVDGDLKGHDGREMRYLYICGINAAGDKDRSVLAFCDDMGKSMTWADQWRGTGQRGTLWSMFNWDYPPDRG